MQSPAKKHFTLVELMVVILIILFLAGIAFIAAPIVQKRNGDATTRSRIRSSTAAGRTASAPTRPPDSTQAAPMPRCIWTLTNSIR